MPDRILLVDASPLIYATYDKIGHLSVQEGPNAGTPTGLRYGFLRSVASYKKKTKADKVAICYDLPGQVKKAVDVQDTYKKNREFTESKATMYGQIPDLKKMIELTGWASIECPGYEADDVIGYVARSKERHGHTCLIVSADHDLCQLVNSKVQIFVPEKTDKATGKKVKEHYLDERGVAGIMGVTPKHLLFYRAVVGDKSDNLEGVELDKYCRDQLAYGLEQLTDPAKGVEEYMDVLTSHLSTSLHTMLSAGIDRIRSNYKVMALPLGTDPDVTAEIKVTKGKRDKQALADLFTQLEFKSMMARIDELTE